MTMQQYTTVASRNTIRAEMKMLKYAEPVEVITKFGDQKEQPLKKTDTVVFRRLQPFNADSNEVPSITAANFVTAEGTNPTANTISYTDVTVTVQQYAVLFKFSSKVELTYEDDIPEDMASLTGKTLAEVRELVAYGAIRAGSNVVYANGSTRTAVNSVISLGKLRQCTRDLDNNRATYVTTAIKPGPDFGTTSVEPSYIVFVHTNVVADCRNLPGFTKRVDYGSAVKPVHPREFGACEDFRFVSSPLFSPHLAGGASVGSTGMLSAGGSACDIYPCVIIGESAWGHVSLKGHGFTGISPTIIPSSEKSKADPIGMFGYVGADFWYAPVRLNENWMTRLEVAATNLDT